MSWKKTTAYFFFQSLRYAQGWKSLQGHLAYYRRWRKFLSAGRSGLGDQLPWLNFPALDLLERAITPGFKVFEYGGGGSTLFFCKRAGEVKTVEDDPAWLDGIKDQVEKNGWRHWQGWLIEPERRAGLETADPANPLHFSSSHKLRKGYSYEKYARAIDPFPDEYFDLILVDGRSRPSCIRQAIPHLKTGGLLVVDNTERPHYLKAFREQILTQFDTLTDQRAPIGYTPDFVRTSIFRKK
ncbi:MAG: hypothetical protein IPH12_03275 [Saprospirales bacterium]|jgi:hypothetical protein|nr:hypothetical protein [Saprospirales bacterium]MBK8921858.1 hypothetical protein [Saprospirales bacterium]